MEANQKEHPDEQPECPSNTNKNALEEYKCCALAEMLVWEFRRQAFGGVLTHPDACAAIDRLGKRLTQMAMDGDISSLLQNCESRGVITHERLAGWRLAQEPKRKKLW